jgi:cytochrome bd ubiquinol oxidase subunit I
MNYPSWDVPILGSGWVIGIIAIIHILISHFAVGGGLYLPLAERKGLREGRADWLEIVRAHSKFFLILTGVFGAVTGVGIWFAIGLASPEGTSTLIHNFVFGWAIEWVFFLLELTAAAVYYYTWNRIPSSLHLKVGYFYAAMSFITLVIINGILTFMLTPGAAWLSVAGTGAEASKFFHAIFNPTYFPSLVLRTLVCVSLAGVWALVTASRIDGYARPALKTAYIRWSVRWFLPAFLLMPFAFYWYLQMVPVAQRGLLQLGISTIGQGTFTMVTRSALVSVMTSATILGVVYLFAWKHPLDFSFGHALTVLFLALAATGATEHAREMIRKPYVVGQHMYSNGVRRQDVAATNKDGYLAKTPWLRDSERLTSATAEAKPTTGTLLARGEIIMRGQCMSCHTADGYRAMRKLLRDRDAQAIANILKMLHEQPKESPYSAFMPPLVGTKEEVEALVVYLDDLAHPPQAPTPAPASDATKPKTVAAR